MKEASGYCEIVQFGVKRIFCVSRWTVQQLYNDTAISLILEH